MARSKFIALILLVTAACGGSGGGGPPDSAVTPADAWVELGTGTTAFEQLITDGDLVLVAGPQGGHHFIVHARMHGLMPGDPAMPGIVANPSTRFTVWAEGGAQIDIAPPPYRLGYEEIEDDVYALASGHIIQVLEEMVPSMYGARVRIEVEVTDATGATVRDERWVTAIEDPNEPEPEPAAWVELGTADDMDTTPFQELPDEGDLVIYAGPQGGNHFFLHARMMGLAPGGATTRFQVFNEVGDRVDLSGPVPLDYQDGGGGTYVLPFGPQVVLDPLEVDAIVDARVRVTVELTDADGLESTDERWVRAVEP